MSLADSVNDDLLKESLLELYEDAPCGYLFTDADGAILRVNHTFLGWTGYSRADLLGSRSFQDLLTVPGKIFYENQYAPLLRMQGFVTEVAFDILRKDRDPLPVLMSSIQRQDGAGRPLVVASTLFDATSRRAYERELLRARRAAEQLAIIVGASDDAILSASSDLVIQTWNPGAERLLGYPSAGIVGRPLLDILPIAAIPAEWGPVEADLRAGRSVHLETLALHQAGEQIDVSASLTPHSGPLGELAGISSIIRDIRARRAVERLQQEFLAMASHELRNPLASIKGHAQLMRRTERYSASGVETIVSQADQLDRLVDDLLLASQVAANRLNLALSEIDLTAEARAAAAAHSRPEGPPVRVEAPSEPVLVRADPLRLRQILANLLTNAIKYSPDGGEIVVSISGTVSEASLAVADRGAGIPAADIPHLFDRFYRVGRTARAPGLGLGLYITNQLVRAHGGRIGVESRVGHGSTFTVTLPASR